MRASIRYACWLTALAALLASRSATAADPNVAACIASYERAQVLSNHGQLIEARTELASCLDARCPATLRHDCGDWLNEVERRQPTVVFDVISKDGALPAGASVQLDGAAWQLPRVGQSALVNPGAHRLVVRAGDRVIEKRFIAIEGKKLDTVTIDLGASAPPQPAPASGRTFPLWPAVVAGGVSVLGLGAFTVFGLSGKAGESDLTKCEPRCARSDVDAVHQKYVVADVSLTVGLVAAAATAVFVILHASSGSSDRAVGLSRAPLAFEF